MEKKIIVTQDFKNWVDTIAKNYRQAQIKAAIRVNSELIEFYFELGREMYNSSFKKKYGDQFFATLSNELTSLVKESKGFSPRNLRYVYSFYTMYKDNSRILQQLVAQLACVPWGHHCCIIDKCKDTNEALFYIQQTIENNWSRAVLLNMLDLKLFERQGKALNNFSAVLPKEGKDLANQITKDPYIFDFVECRNDYDEKELKDLLVDNIQKFLLELGTGFAYLGREYRLDVGDSELFIDMLFYNISVHAYVVIEIKTTSFKPEFIGQLGTYVVAVDHQLKTEIDAKTIGILVCKHKNEILAGYALESSTQPIGVSSYELSKLIPEEFKSSLPTVEEIEEELKTKQH